MNGKNKKILSGFIDAIGYGGAITYTMILTWLTHQIYKHGIVSISEPNVYIILSEFGFGITTVGFLIYKFYKSLKKREKELSEL